MIMRRSRKVTNKDYNKCLIAEKPNFFNLYEDENESACIDINNRLLKAFYIFIMQIFKKFNNYERDEYMDDDDIISESRVPSFVINLKEENNIKIEKEKEKEDLQFINEKQLAKKAE